MYRAPVRRGRFDGEPRPKKRAARGPRRVEATGDLEESAVGGRIRRPRTDERLARLGRRAEGRKQETLPGVPESGAHEEDQTGEDTDTAFSPRESDAGRRRDDERGPKGSRWRHGENGCRENPRRQGASKRKRRRSSLPRPRRAHAALLSDFPPREQGDRLHVVRLGEEIEERQPLDGVARLQGRKVACERRRIARDHQEMSRREAQDPGAHARREARARRVGNKHVNRRFRKFLRMKKRLRRGPDGAREGKALGMPGLKIP